MIDISTFKHQSSFLMFHYGCSDIFKLFIIFLFQFFGIATTNNIEKLDKALYREGRLTPIYFDHCDTSQIIKFIEKFYKIELLDEQKKNLPDKSYQLAPSKVITLLEKYENNLDGLLMYFEKLEKQVV